MKCLASALIFLGVFLSFGVVDFDWLSIKASGNVFTSGRTQVWADQKEGSVNEVRVGMIGSGYMALTYCEALVRHVSGAELSAVAGGTRAPGLAHDYGVEAESSIEALLDRNDVDAVVITSPERYHAEATIQAAGAGKHVLVEKPMAVQVSECDRMIEACQTAGVDLSVVKTERFRSICKKAKGLIEAGELGPLWMMRTVSAFPIEATRSMYESRPWWYEPEGAGLFVNMAAHNADFLRWLTGANAVQVFAQAQTFSDIPAPVPHSVMAQIVFEGDLMAHMWISSELPAPGLPSSEVRFQVVGRDGILDMESYEFLDLGKGGEWKRVFAPEGFDYLAGPKNPVRLEPHIGVVQEFVNGLLEGRQPTVGGEDGRAAVEICQACLESAKKGEVVRLS